MQQGTLDVRFPRACGRYRQTRWVRGCHTSPGCLSRRRAGRVCQESLPRRHDGSLPPEYAVSRPEKTHGVRARPSGRPLKGISARPGRYPRWKRQACSVFGGSKIQPAFHVACFHLPCSGTVFLYTAPEAADVVHKIEYRLIPVFACHRVQAGTVVPSILSRHKCLTV